MSLISHQYSYYECINIQGMPSCRENVIMWTMRIHLGNIGLELGNSVPQTSYFLINCMMCTVPGRKMFFSPHAPVWYRTVFISVHRAVYGARDCFIVFCCTNIICNSATVLCLFVLLMHPPVKCQLSNACLLCFYAVICCTVIHCVNILRLCRGI